MSKTKQTAEDHHHPQPVSTLQALSSHLTCGSGVALALWVARSFDSTDLVSDPTRTLRLLWVLQCPVVILVYSRFRVEPRKCSYLAAAARGVITFPLGALVNAFGAIALGAPVGIQFLWKTIHWSLLMSSLTVVSLGHHGHIGNVHLHVQTHGVVIGAWFGAWPMPLDWERPWQEWPICVTYGALGGYLVAMLVCVSIVAARSKQQRVKRD